MRGDELAVRLTKDRRDMKCLFISGYAEIKEHHDQLDVLGIDFIQKPFDIDTLVNKVREILDSE